MSSYYDSNKSNMFYIMIILLLFAIVKGAGLKSQLYTQRFGSFANSNKIHSKIQISNTNSSMIKNSESKKIGEGPEKAVTQTFKSMQNHFEQALSQYIKNFADEKKFATIEKCSSTNCPEPYGNCFSHNKCSCNFEYINVPNSKALCSYKLSSQLIALILETFFPFGVGHFYCNRILIAIIKFSALLLIPSVICYIFKNTFFKREENINSLLVKSAVRNNSYYSDLLKKAFITSYIISFLSWYMFDFINFFYNKHKDGSGYDLIELKI